MILMFGGFRLNQNSWAAVERLREYLVYLHR